VNLVDRQLVTTAGAVLLAAACLLLAYGVATSTHL
jgi:hypothetical protein